jgi:hypothetical protein
MNHFRTEESSLLRDIRSFLVSDPRRGYSFCRLGFLVSWVLRGGVRSAVMECLNYSLCINFQR